MLKILHFADMHLDSPFGGVGASQSEKLRANLRSVFCEITETATNEGCDAILVAGDLFDCGYVTPATLAVVRDAFERYGKPVVIAAGNHDPYGPGSVWTSTDWSENVHIFPDDRLSSFDLDDETGMPITVWGWSFLSDTLASSPLGDIRVDQSRINLVCAHADLSSPISKYAPTPAALFEASGAVYAALGHVHKLPPPVTCGKTLVSYSGFPEGRSFDEEGDGGVNVVEISESGANIRRVKTSHHKYQSEDIDVTGEDGDSSVAAKIASLCQTKCYESDTSLRVFIKGSLPESYVPSPDAICREVERLLDDVSPNAVPYSLTVTDRTMPFFEADYLKNDPSIRGEFYRTLLPALSSHDENERVRAAAALRAGLTALDGNTPL